MFTIVRPDETVVRERQRADGGTTTDLRYFGKFSGRDTTSEAFLVHVQDREVRAHFHPVDQFQILLGAPGSRYQRHELPAFTLHYADAYATYGPMSGEDPPLRFFTLRAEASGFTAYMPEQRDKLAWRGKRHHQAGFDRLPVEAFPAAGGKRVEQVFGRDDDGFEALAIVAGTSTQIHPPGDGWHERAVHHDCRRLRIPRREGVWSRVAGVAGHRGVCCRTRGGETRLPTLRPQVPLSLDERPAPWSRDREARITGGASAGLTENCWRDYDWTRSAPAIGLGGAQTQ